MCPSLRESIYRLTWRSVTRLPDIQCSPAIAGEHCSRRPQRTPTGHCSCRQAATVIVAAHEWQLSTEVVQKRAIGGGRCAVFGGHGGRGAGKSAGASGLSEAIRFGSPPSAVLHRRS